jgi:hypothetical protein
MALLYKELVECCENAELGEVPLSSQSRQRFLNPWNGISVLHGECVQPTAVDADSQSTSMLADDDNWSAGW